MRTTLKELFLWVDGVIGGGLLVGLSDNGYKILAGAICLTCLWLLIAWREQK
jgi:hypothetical protein